MITSTSDNTFYVLELDREVHPRSTTAAGIAGTAAAAPRFLRVDGNSLLVAAKRNVSVTSLRHILRSRIRLLCDLDPTARVCVNVIDFALLERVNRSSITTSTDKPGGRNMAVMALIVDPAGEKCGIREYKVPTRDVSALFIPRCLCMCCFRAVS